MKVVLSPGSLIGEEAGKSFFQKMLVASLILALLFASLPAAGAAAAGSQNTKGLENEWQAKIDNVEVESVFYQRVRVYPADFEDPDELVQANNILNNYGAALRSAQRGVFNHVGFDAKGNVINENQANQSIKEVASYLHTMRALRKQLGDLEGKYRLLPMSVVNAPPAQ